MTDATKSPSASLDATDFGAILGPAVPRDPTRQVFVNRNLNMARIETIGFDMDYTLAPYHQHAMDALSIQMTVRKLIENKGYPAEIHDARLDHAFIIRGLAVDKETGNIFKMDSRRHVGRCYHGYTSVSPEKRRELYAAAPINISSKRFAWVDTLFSLPEATLLAGIIQHWESSGRPLPWSYQRLFDDIRESIDEAHRDNSLKAVITAELPTYIDRDPDLAASLHKLRSAGKRLFLLTNSEWFYTDAVMRFLLEGALPFYKSWRNYFDVVIVSGRKPAFFTENAPFLELDGTGEPLGEATTLERGKIYQGGNVRDLERMAQIVGEHTLYVGDHIYGDILRSKKHSVWRTALIVQEMEETLRLTQEFRDPLRRIEMLEELAIRLDHDINYHLTLLKSLGRWSEIPGGLRGPESRVIESTRDRAKGELDVKRELLRRTVAELEALETETDGRFNPYWGRLFREGNERSVFGGQVSDYADVYTSRVSNFLGYSPVQYFRSPRDVMPHERGF
jgi:HAD superfamily 5'-nucleotidase-like hydrolase